jgi:hypothetical protein
MQKFYPNRNRFCPYFIPDMQAKNLGEVARRDGYSLPIR